MHFIYNIRAHDEIAENTIIRDKLVIYFWIIYCMNFRTNQIYLKKN